MKGPVSIFKKYNELALWITALILLYFLNPEGEHFTFCLFQQIGFTHCPGCGIGHAIHYALHLNWQSSWNAHWLGIPGLFIILYRIYQLLYTYHQNNTYGPATVNDDTRPAT